jgi:S1-C subfamily serine protease
MSQIFTDISDAMADAVQNTGSGVVRIEGRRRLGSTGIAWRDGVIVAAHHSVNRNDVRIGLPDGSTANATVVGRDPRTDLAVLRTDAALAPLPQADGSNPLRVGNLVLAIGRPLEELRATIGVVSALDMRRMQGAIQTDVVMYPGFSGGPLVDASGVVQGMNTSGLARGASIAVATHSINAVVDTLLAHGHMRQGYLGVGVQPVRLSDDIAEQINQETGLMVSSVENGSPAAASMYQGDIIVAVDGEATPHIDALQLLLSGDRVGAAVPVRIVRGGTLQDVQVTIGEQPSS